MLGAVNSTWYKASTKTTTHTNVMIIVSRLVSEFLLQGLKQMSSHLAAFLRASARLLMVVKWALDILHLLHTVLSPISKYLVHMASLKCHPDP
jgi:hypothetical protein